MAKKAIIVQKTIVEIQYVKRTALRLIIIFLTIRIRRDSVHNLFVRLRFVLKSDLTKDTIRYLS